MQREIQRMVQVVIQVRAGADDEVHQPAIHHLDDAAADAGRRHGAGNRQPDGRVFLGIEHFFGENPARLRQARGVERLKPLIDEVADFLAALRADKT